MKSRGDFRVATQHGNWGYFGAVELEAEILSSGTGVEVVIPPEIAEWRAGIRFGIAYAYEKCAGLGSPRNAVRVAVIRAEGHAVDTTELVMAFVSAHALWRALNETPVRTPSLNAAEGIFAFPK
jgi:hypothetical protein